MNQRSIARWIGVFLAGAASLCAAAQSFDTCLGDLRTQARQAGIRPETVSTAFANIRQRPDVIQTDRGGQSEFISSFWDYLQRSLSPTRLQNGQALLEQHRPLLTRIYEEYGVPPEYLVAFWGLETNFGNYFGDIPTLDALATLACDPRRSRMFSRQLIDAVAMVDEGRLDLADLRGSWAGAMGHTQFMPTTMRHYAVDYDHDGRIDLWHSLPDAFASAANYLSQMGWRSGERWGEEVTLRDASVLTYAGYKESKPVSQWTQLGVRRVDATSLPDRADLVSLLAPGGADGPVFVTYPNFRVIMRWNASTSYALAVGLLADRLAGAPALHAQAPRVTRYRRADGREIQQHLKTLGYPIERMDGVIGGATRAAIRDFQRRSGQPVDGEPDEALLRALRAATGQASSGDAPSAPTLGAPVSP
ncbi:MAG: lytic murein transglycosylase [Pseudomonadota bacterium]